MALDWNKEVSFDSIKKLVKRPGKGAQKGDGTASISAQEQLRQTEDVILNMMNDPSGT